jgi:hypothetical protein
MIFRAIALTLALTAGVAGASELSRFRGKLRAYAMDVAIPFNPRSLCVCNEAGARALAGALYQVAPGYVSCAIPLFTSDGTAYAVRDCFDYDVLSK